LLHSLVIKSVENNSTMSLSLTLNKFDKVKHHIEKKNHKFIML